MITAGVRRPVVLDCRVPSEKSRALPRGQGEEPGRSAAKGGGKPPADRLQRAPARLPWGGFGRGMPAQAPHPSPWGLGLLAPDARIRPAAVRSGAVRSGAEEG